MKRLTSLVVLSFAVIGFTACPGTDKTATGTTDTTTSRGPGDANAAAAVVRTRQTIGSVADAIAKAKDNANHAGKENAEVTKAIKYYESLSADERVKALVTDRERLKTVFAEPAWGDPRETLPAPSQVKRTGSVLFEPKEVDPANFDLALRNTDLYAKQVRVTNDLFHDADPKVMNAIGAYEKMTAEQKKAFVMGSNSDFNIYYTYWNYVYLQHQAWMLRQVYLYMYECYWGYQTPGALRNAQLDDRAFDLTHRRTNR